MKKSVIILIGVIYIMAIATVSFFGLKIGEFDATEYVTNVVFTNKDIEELKNGDKIIRVRYQENITYQLEWEVTPDNATHKEVNFIYDTSSTVGSVDENGLVTINSQGVLKVTISSTDGSAKKDSLKLIIL